MKNLIFTLLALTSFSAFAANYTCNGIGYFGNQEIGLDIKNSFWTGEVKSVIYTDYGYPETEEKFSLSKMYIDLLPYGFESFEEYARPTLQEYQEKEKSEFYHFEKARKTYSFEKGLLENAATGWVIVAKKPSPLCIWHNNCGTELIPYNCHRND